ncbi:MAG: VWA domain-containing protein [Chloroflexi bacterium]|nr:VWA domain-containing protein [Chloroflexota bacterium]
MKDWMRNERGQSGIFLALALVGVIAFVALVVDGGNAYNQRRQVQNAVDAAAFAGAEVLARPTLENRTPVVYTSVINQRILDYARRNGINLAAGSARPTDVVKPYYLLRGPQGTLTPAPFSKYDKVEYGNNGQLQIPTTGESVVGIQVVADKRFDTFFAGVIGWREMQVGSAAKSYITCGICSISSGLWPVAMKNTTFDTNGDGVSDLEFGREVQIWEKEMEGRGHFEYLHWRGEGVNTPELESNMSAYLNGTADSGRWGYGDWVPGTPGAKMASGVKDEWIAAIGRSVTVPVYDSTRGGGANLEYHIIGFARLKITEVCVSKNDQTSGCDIKDASDSYIEGIFERWESPQGDGGCPDFGVCTGKERPPVTSTPTSRSIVGVVKLNQLSPASPYTDTVHVPVDVMHVLDVSNSMDQSFGNPPQLKITTAKNSLILFNNMISPTLGDRIGLTSFPKQGEGSNLYNWYTYNANQNKCQTDKNKQVSIKYWGQKELDLTWMTATVNSRINGLQMYPGTPLGHGLMLARQAVLDPTYHNATHVPVLIIASDGIANVKNNGEWTGFDGYSYSDNLCNAEAVQDAINQANKAKADNNGDGRPDIIIFTIAIGTDFNPVSLQAIASEPSNTHFFQVGDAATMSNIYSQIATRMQTIGGECNFTAKEVFAPNATVRVRNLTTGQQWSTTTTSVGYFQFDNVPPGTYEFQTMSVTMAGLNYHVFTEGTGGPDLTALPKLDVPDTAGTFEKNLYLRTDDPSGCDVVRPTATPLPPAPTLAPTPTWTTQPTATKTPTFGPSPTPSKTPTATLTKTATPTKTNTPTITPGPSPTPTRTNTPQPTKTFTPTATKTPTITPGPSPTPTRTNTPTKTPTITPTRTPSPTPRIGYNAPVLPQIKVALALPVTGGQAAPDVKRVSITVSQISVGSGERYVAYRDETLMLTLPYPT